jgi:hypothetical protein
MRLRGPVTLDEVLASLVGQGPRIASSTGPQLQRVREGILIDHDPWQSIDQAERAIGRDLGVVRCLEDLASVRFVQTRWVSALVSLHRRCKQYNQGAIAVALLRSYGEWGLTSKERALAAVAVLAQRLAGGTGCDANELADAFRGGREAETRRRAARLYSDAFEVVAEWVRLWNRKHPVNLEGL